MRDELAHQEDTGISAASFRPADWTPDCRAASPPPIATAGVVHDLGNLIQIASAAINMVTRNPDMPVVQSGPMLRRANASLESAGDLVRETMKLLRERPNSRDHCSLADCIADVTALVEHMADRGFSIELHAEPDLPDVACSPLGLQNALLNLVFNARDAMTGSGIVLIEAEVLGSGVPMVEIRVIDSGHGMSRDTIDRAFEPFFTTKSDGLGGIGLPMVKQFVGKCGGEISIDSEPGVGTTIVLRLPMIAGEARTGLKYERNRLPREMSQ